MCECLHRARTSKTWLKNVASIPTFSLSNGDVWWQTNAIGRNWKGKVRERKSNSGSPFVKSTLAETRRLESLTFANVGLRLNFVP
jgi:hypothetical protein